jgi:hypothetical protein
MLERRTVMKTLSVWIVGILGLGVGIGSFLSGSASLSDLPETELELAVERASLVDCGEGREALLAPVDDNGATSFKIRCVPTERSRPTPASTAAVHPAPAPPPAHPVAAASSTGHAERMDVVEIGDDENDSRSWKQSAVVIGGSAGAGAGIGAIAKGKKGAAVGAAIGAASGAAYELLKRDKKN